MITELRPQYPASYVMGNRHVDSDDVMSVACGLASDAHIWSGDSDFDDQDAVAASSTTEIIDSFDTAYPISSPISNRGCRSWSFSSPVRSLFIADGVRRAGPFDVEFHFLSFLAIQTVDASRVEDHVLVRRNETIAAVFVEGDRLRASDPIRMVDRVAEGSDGNVEEDCRSQEPDVPPR